MEMYEGAESCPRLYNLQVIMEFELEVSSGLSARPLTIEQPSIRHFQADFIRTPSDHPMNAKVY